MHVHIRAFVHVRNRQGEATSDNQEEEKIGEGGGQEKDHTATQKRMEDGEIKWERNESEAYLFWQPPSPPRSSEKFLRFHQHQLNHKEKKSPMSTDGEKER